MAKGPLKTGVAGPGERGPQLDNGPVYQGKRQVTLAGDPHAEARQAPLGGFWLQAAVVLLGMRVFCQMLVTQAAFFFFFNPVGHYPVELLATERRRRHPTQVSFEGDWKGLCRATLIAGYELRWVGEASWF